MTSLFPTKVSCEVCGKPYVEVAIVKNDLLMVSQHYNKCLEGKLIKDQTRLESEVTGEKPIGDQDLCLPPTLGINMNREAVKHALKEMWKSFLGIMLILGVMMLFLGFLVLLMAHPIIVIGSIVGMILLAVFLNEYWEYDMSHQRKDDRVD